MLDPYMYDPLAKEQPASKWKIIVCRKEHYWHEIEITTIIGLENYALEKAKRMYPKAEHLFVSDQATLCYHYDETGSLVRIDETWGFGK